MGYDDILLETEERMEKTVGNFENDLKAIRGARATTGLVESVRVAYYGSQSPLKTLANLSVPEPRLLVIRPFDASAIKEIEKAILTSDLGMTPQSDGKVIRLVVPPLSEERRRQLAGKIKEMGEAAKVGLRNIRRDGNKLVDESEKDSELTEDEAKKLKEEIQELIKQYEAKTDNLIKTKSAELMDT